MKPGDPAAISRWLRDPLANRGTAWPEAERRRLGLSGLLPPRVESLEEQAARVLESLRRKASPLDRYVQLSALQNENETLFYRVVMDHLEELLPVIYTPTVGQACLEWSQLFERPRGLYIAASERGRVAELLANWPQREVGILVVTDGGRILGLGDLGANGMGIPIGKLALYTACAGVPPERCLPVLLDVGTDNEALRRDALYLGTRAPRLSGEAYDALLDEFIAAVREVFPGAVLQFEDFHNANAFRLLGRYRDQLCCFNDDVQGTGAMGLAGLQAAGRATGRALRDERILFAGAGEACLGIGRLLVAALCEAGLSQAQARARCLFFDSRGAVLASRADLPPHKREVAQERAPLPDLVSAIEAFRPTVLFGASGRGGLFSRPVLEAMARSQERPVVFALSNPTSKSECTAEQAYAWTGGRAIFASGSPFAPVTRAGRTHAPGQANNSCVFPGVGLGLLVSGASCASEEMFLAAARAVSGCVSDADLAAGRIFPGAARLREVAAAVAGAVAAVAFDRGHATRPRPPDLPAEVRRSMYQPCYR